MIKQKWKHKGGIAVRKIVLIVIGVSLMAVVMLTIQGAIESAYTKGLENALVDS